MSPEDFFVGGALVKIGLNFVAFGFFESKLLFNQFLTFRIGTNGLSVRDSGGAGIGGDFFGPGFAINTRLATARTKVSGNG